MKLVIENSSALLEAISGGDLYGFKAEAVYDVTEWKFPVLLEVNEKNKTFKLVEEGHKEKEEAADVKVVTSKKKDKFKKYFIIAAAVVDVVIVAIVVYNLV